jgi:hypothetical protein
VVDCCRDVAQLDPGFTSDGFLAHVAVEAIAALLGTLGALVVALVVFRKTSALDRSLFQETINNEIDMRENERRLERSDRESEELAEFHQLLRRIAREVAFNRRLVQLAPVGAGPIPLRTDAISSLFSLPRSILESLDISLHQTLYVIERYNWTAPATTFQPHLMRCVTLPTG